MTPKGRISGPFRCETVRVRSARNHPEGAPTKAIGYQQSLPVEDPQSLRDIDLPEPTPGPRDLLVEVRAISVNPVDTKIRMRVQPEAGQHQVLGWVAAGVVRAVGSEVTLFKAGDEVFYAGALDLPGTNSELHLVNAANLRKAHAFIESGKAKGKIVLKASKPNGNTASRGGMLPTL